MCTITMEAWATTEDFSLPTIPIIEYISYGQDLLTNHPPCVHDFNHVLSEILNMYGNKDCKLNRGMRLDNEFRQSHHNTDESEWAYTHQW